MRFEVPQFIEIEDKIFGPFTWKQFVYLMGGVGIAVVLFLTTPIIVFILLGVPIGSLAILLAFYPVNNRPFSVFLESALQYMSANKLYLWRKRGTGVYNGQQTDPTEATIEQNAYVPNVSTNNLTSLSRKLELNAIQKDQ